MEAAAAVRRDCGCDAGVGIAAAAEVGVVGAVVRGVEGPGPLELLAAAAWAVVVVVVEVGAAVVAVAVAVAAGE